MGFCFINNAAVAAQAALEADAERVAIFDWDVHHGNGTQDIFYDRGRRVLRITPRGRVCTPVPVRSRRLARATATVRIST